MNQPCTMICTQAQFTYSLSWSSKDVFWGVADLAPELCPDKMDLCSLASRLRALLCNPGGDLVINCGVIQSFRYRNLLATIKDSCLKIGPQGSIEGFVLRNVGRRICHRLQHRGDCLNQQGSDVLGCNLLISMHLHTGDPCIAGDKCLK